MNGPHLRFAELLRSRTEWIAIHENGRVFSLRNHEMDFASEGRSPTFGFLDTDGYRVRRVLSVEIVGQRAELILAGRFGAAPTRLELVPRTLPSELGAELEMSRLAAANRLAETVAASSPGSRLRRVFLNQANGRVAHFVLNAGVSSHRGVIADISGGLSPERLLSSAVTWLHKASSSRKDRMTGVSVLAGKGRLAGVRRLHACLAPEFGERIGVLFLKDAEGGSAASVVEARRLEMDSLWRAKPPPANPVRETRLSQLAASIAAADDVNIDHLFSKNGITLRFRGLPFARFRTVKGAERAWFGVGRNKRVLCDSSKEDLESLMERLAEYRCHDSPNKQHLYYQSSEEAWLESVFRRNVRRLDANLILSPIHSQFRTSRDRIDLLALRRDGTLVIIELKVVYDSGMVFQAVDYWRRIEHQRRKGVLAAARLFGKRRIADRPAMIYLAAPTLCFREQTAVLCDAVSPDIRIVRFELNEDWRREVKVLRILG